jgi:PAS domain S-box-containing protein
VQPQEVLNALCFNCFTTPVETETSETTFPLARHRPETLPRHLSSHANGRTIIREERTMSKLPHFSFRTVLASASALINNAHTRAGDRPAIAGMWRPHVGYGTPRVKLQVAEREKAEAALPESERDLRSAIDGIPGFVAILAPNGEIESVNRQIVEYFGLPLEELKNRVSNEMIHNEDRSRVAEAFTRSIACGCPFHFELRNQRFDGEYRWFDVHGAPIRDDSGRITRWSVLLTDIEDRTQALARLQQTQSNFAHVNRVSMVGELASSLSHEIIEPIASARNNACAARNFLATQPPDLREVNQALASVVDDVDRAGEIIYRIREHIQKSPPRKAHFDLNAAINEVIILARSAIIRNGVWVHSRLADGLLPVEGDRIQLQQVVLNLVLNAVEAMGSVESGARDLSISTEQAHTDVIVAVRDSGPGIDPDHLDRVFEAFYTTKPSGTGMGLSICRSIIDAHGGRLWAEANEHRGALFQFTLPGAEAELTNPLQARESI